MTFLTDFTIGRYIVVHIDNLIFKYSFDMVKGKNVRTPSGVYGQDVSLTQGTFPAWWLVLIYSWVNWSNGKLRALLKGIAR